MSKLTFKEREQLVRDSLTAGMSIEDIAKLIDCEPDFVKIIVEFVMSNKIERYPTERRCNV